MEDVCKRVVMHLMHRQLAMAFDTWHEHSCRQKRHEDVCTRVLMHWMHRVSALAFDTWWVLQSGSSGYGMQGQPIRLLSIMFCNPARTTWLQ